MFIMKFNKLTLSFSGEYKKFEAPFKESYFRKSIGHLRLCHVLTIFAFASAGLVDAIVFPEERNTLWFIRYALVFPLFPVGLFITYTRYYERYWQAMSFVYILATGLSSSALIAVAPAPLNHYYFASVILCLLFGFAFVRARFIIGALAGIILLAGYEFVSVFMVSTPPVILFNNTFYLVAVILVGMFISYSLERAERKDFYLTCMLNKERKKTASANVELEKRVQQRTSELEKSNQELALEIVENKKAKSDKAFLELQLRQAYKMEAIGTLAGGIAHDFNNILTSVLGYTELALMEAPDNSGIEENLNEVLTAGTRARDLVKQILTFSRQTEHEIRPVRISTIIKEVVKLIRASLPSTIEIRQDIENQSTVMADPTQIHQVLMNLCTNSGHAMKDKGGILEVRLSDIVVDAQFAERHHGLKPGSFLQLRIKDNGCGMESEIIDRIFDPFYTTKAKGEGTCMGLSVVHGIIKSHNGIVTVDSAPGKGACFDIYIPVIENQEKVDPNKPSEIIVGGSERILFVDDEQALVHMGRQILEKIGYSVETRTSSIEALGLFKGDADRFDLVITDLTMPNMQGDELSSEITAIKEDMPVILCTGFSLGITDAQAQASGIRAVVEKPILVNEISKVIRKVLDEAK